MHLYFPSFSSCLLLAAVLSVTSGLEVVGQGIDNDVPADTADPESGNVKSLEKLKGYIGLSVDHVPAAVRAQTTLEDGFGLSVVYVVPGGPGDNAGLRRYDILSKFDDQRLAEPATLSWLASSKLPGDGVTLTVLRRGDVLKLQVTLGDYRDAPDGLTSGNDAQNAQLIDTIVELFRRRDAGMEIDLSTTRDGDIRLGWNESMNGLLTDLRNRSGKDGIRLETLERAYRLEISTSDMDIVVTSHGDDGASWILARRKDGATVFDGPFGDETPDELRRIVEDAPAMQSLPQLPKLNDR